MKKNQEKGFAAIIITLAISAIISAIVIPAAFRAHSSASNLLGAQLKQESRFAAESCLFAAVLLLYEFGEIADLPQTFNIAGASNCTIHSAIQTGEHKIIKAESIAGNTNTILRANWSDSTEKILSLEELAL